MTETPITRTPAAQSPTAQSPTVQAPTVQSPATGTAAVPGPAAGSAESTAGTKAGTAAGGADPGAADAVIAVRRQRIDELDARIIALVQERMSVSGEIQAARIGSGGRRVHLSRELEVLRTYGGALGKP
ncbi:MAG: chorismate mutase, partial [Actinomycetia bacterium]|nr:chorismate mutase [Actinomycetes bacterium]